MTSEGNQNEPCPFCHGPALEWCNHKGKHVCCNDHECPGYRVVASPREWNTRPATPTAAPELLPKETRTLAGIRVHFSGEIEGTQRDRLVEQATELGATVLPFPEPNCYIVHGKSPRICDEWMLSHCMPTGRWQEFIERRQDERAARYWPADPNDRRAHGDDMLRRQIATPAAHGMSEGVLRMSELGLTEKPTSLNAYIDAHVAEKAYTACDLGGKVQVVRAEDAAEIARGAVLHTIADRETLIRNLRGAGYTVTRPVVYGKPFGTEMK